MKKFLPVLILFLLAALVWNVFVSPGDMHVQFDGDEIDGPLGVLLGTVFAGGGLLIAGVVLVLVAALLAVVFAGVGILVVSVLALVAVGVAVLVAPFMLPFLIPVGIVWFFVSRARRIRAKAAAQAA